MVRFHLGAHIPPFYCMVTSFITSTSGRLDIVLHGEAGMSRSQAQRRIRAGCVQVQNSIVTKVGQLVKEGDVITLSPLLAAEEKDTPVRLEQDGTGNIRIVTDEPTFLVIEKPSGILVHPTDAGEQYTVSQWFAHRYPKSADIGHARRPGIVHRLDKDASGLLVLAKTPEMYTHLKRQFAERTVKKIYTILVHDRVEQDHHVIEFPIGRGRDGRMAARPHIARVSLKNVRSLQEGKDAKTQYDVLTRYANATLLSVQIHTGRTHQIRVHMRAMNHPVVGDRLYADAYTARPLEKRAPRLFLHASMLSFTDLSGEVRSFESPLPAELSALLVGLHTVS